MKIKARRRAILLGVLAICYSSGLLHRRVAGTCGFDGCPTPRDIQTFQPDQGGRILDRYNRAHGTVGNRSPHQCSAQAVPEFVQQAFIATEDRRFYQHGGLDWRGFFRALATNLKAGRPREGFSTITMQVARNTFAVRKYPARSLRQKLTELRLSRLIEQSLTKQQILELYFNVIYMGNGVYGVEAASRDLFGKSVNQLNLPQAAMLAALPKAPSRTLRDVIPIARSAPQSRAEPDGEEGLRLGEQARADCRRSRSRIARDEWRPKDPNDSYRARRGARDRRLDHSGAERRDIVDLTVRTTLDRNGADRGRSRSPPPGSGRFNRRRVAAR